MSFRSKSRTSNKSQNHMNHMKAVKQERSREGPGSGSVLNLTLNHGVRLQDFALLGADNRLRTS